MLKQICFIGAITLAGCGAAGTIDDSSQGEATPQALANDKGCVFSVTLVDGTVTCLEGDGSQSPGSGSSDAPGMPGKSVGSGLFVTSALYGLNCTSNPAQALYDVRAECQTQDWCDYTVDYTRLGDPAPGCAKDFHVGWYCTKGGPKYRRVVPAEAGFGSVARLSCPNG